MAGCVKWSGTTWVLGEVTSPLAGAEIARWKAAADAATLRVGVLIAAEDSAIAGRWIFEDNVEAIL